MNQILVACLFLSTLAALVAATLAFVAGLGLLAGLLVYCATGSVTLVSTALAAQSAEAKRLARLRAEREAAKSAAASAFA